MKGKPLAFTKEQAKKWVALSKDKRIIATAESLSELTQQYGNEVMYMKVPRSDISFVF